LRKKGAGVFPVPVFLVFQSVKVGKSLEEPKQWYCGDGILTVPPGLSDGT